MEAEEHKEVEVAKVVVVVTEGVVGIDDAEAAGGGNQGSNQDGAYLGFFLLGEVSWENEEHKLFFVDGLGDFVAEFEVGLFDGHTAFVLSGVCGHRAVGFGTHRTPDLIGMELL